MLHVLIHQQPTVHPLGQGPFQTLCFSTYNLHKLKMFTSLTATSKMRSWNRYLSADTLYRAYLDTIQELKELSSASSKRTYFSVKFRKKMTQ